MLGQSIFMNNSYHNSSDLQTIIRKYFEYGFSPEQIINAYKITKGNELYILDELLKANKDHRNNQQTPGNKQQTATNSNMNTQLDLDLKKAIALSLKQQNVDDEQDLEQFIKQTDIPLGLKNLGQTCYLNVILQTTYWIREIRDQILKFDFTNEVKDEKMNQLQQMLKSCQFLFAYMFKGKKSFADPQNLFLNLEKINGEVFKIGEQNDFYQFQNCFFENLEKAFELSFKKKPLDTSKIQIVDDTSSDFSIINKIDDEQKEKKQEHIDQSELNPVTELFYGVFEETFTQTLNQTQKLTQIKEQYFGPRILQVKYGNLYQAIENDMNVVIDDLITKDGKKGEANLQYKIKKAPQILNFYINRLEFDQSSMKYQKLNQPFYFDKIIYMDRYMKDSSLNQVQQSELQDQISILDKRIAKLEQVLADWDNYNKTNIEIEKCINNTIEFLQKQKVMSQNDDFVQLENIDNEIQDIYNNIGITGGSKDLEITIKNLVEYQKSIKSQKQKVLEKLEIYKKQRKELHNKSTNYGYELFSIIMHEGTSNSGHYYCYVFDEKHNSWLKFNDRYVTKVDESEIFQEAQGNGKSLKNACSLFYRNIKNKIKVDQPVSFNAKLKKDVEVIDQQFFDEVDYSVVFKAMDGLQMQVQNAGRKFIQQQQNNQISFYSNYLDLNQFLYCQEEFQHYANWNMMIQLYEKADKSVILEKLRKKSNLEVGLEKYFAKLKQHIKICGLKLRPEQENEFKQLKLFHTQMMYIFNMVNNLYKLQIEDKKQFVKVLQELEKIHQFQFLKISQQLLQSTNLGITMTAHVTQIGALNMLKGCFVIDYLIAQQKTADIIPTINLMSNILLQFYRDQGLLIQQIASNWENTILLIQSNQLSYPSIVTKLQESIAAITSKGKVNLQSSANQFDIKEVEKYNLNELNQELTTNRLKSSQTLALWKQFYATIQKSKQMIPQAHRIEQEQLQYFESKLN